MVTPVLTYGAEIWGYKESKDIEKVQASFCKHVLGLSRNASNVAAIGECGRKPLKVLYFTKCAKYWLKPCSLAEQRLNRRCYIMLKNLDEAGRITWATHVKQLLYQYPR